MEKDQREKSGFFDLPAPETRKQLLEKLQKIIWRERLIEINPSEAGINPNTQLEKHPPLFFGIGGGGKELSRALPFDILPMILVGQKLKQNLGLGPLYILLADETTCTNGFSQQDVARLMTGLKSLLEIILKGLGKKNDWIVFLESELDETLGSEARVYYETRISDVQKTGLPIYYAREIAATLIFDLIGENKGIIKLGWTGKGVHDDEEAFDKETVSYLQLRNISNRLSFIYTPVGVRIFPGTTGMLERAPPYICSQPWNRILLKPSEDPIAKLRKATLAGGGLQWKQSKRLFDGSTFLFEELVYREISTSEKQEFQGQKIAEKIDFIIQYIFNGREKEAETIWNETFQKAL